MKSAFPALLTASLFCLAPSQALAGPPPVAADKASASFLLPNSEEFLKTRKPLPKLSPVPMISSPPLKYRTEFAEGPKAPEGVVIEPYILSMENAPLRIGLVNASAKDTRWTKVGDQLRIGETFHTEEGQTTRLQMDPETDVLLAPNSVLTMSTLGTKPMLFLEAGQMRVLCSGEPRDENVEKEKDPKKRLKLMIDSVKPPVTYKLYVKTPTMLLAVKGTDFIVTVPDKEHSSVHTASGIVFAGANEKVVNGNDPVLVPPEHCVEHVAGARVQRASKFEIGMFVKEFFERSPQMEFYYNSAVSEARRGITAAKFRALRAKLEAERDARYKKVKDTYDDRKHGFIEAVDANVPRPPKGGGPAPGGIPDSDAPAAAESTVAGEGDAAEPPIPHHDDSDDEDGAKPGKPKKKAVHRRQYH